MSYPPVFTDEQGRKRPTTPRQGTPYTDAELRIQVQNAPRPDDRLGKYRSHQSDSKHLDRFRDDIKAKKIGHIITNHAIDQQSSFEQITQMGDLELEQFHNELHEKLEASPRISRPRTPTTPRTPSIRTPVEREVKFDTGGEDEADALIRVLERAGLDRIRNVEVAEGPSITVSGPLTPADIERITEIRNAVKEALKQTDYGPPISGVSGKVAEGTGVVLSPGITQRQIRRIRTRDLSGASPAPHYLKNLDNVVAEQIQRERARRGLRPLTQEDIYRGGSVEEETEEGSEQ